LGYGLRIRDGLKDDFGVITRDFLFLTVEGNSNNQRGANLRAQQKSKKCQPKKQSEIIKIINMREKKPEIISYIV
jgi:hypothetical protein